MAQKGHLYAQVINYITIIIGFNKTIVIIINFS
jgi:hypothetical protein